jgi:hypothetical protein
LESGSGNIANCRCSFENKVFQGQLLHFGRREKKMRGTGYRNQLFNKNLGKTS